MKRVLVLGALVALMAVRGGAEDPKPEDPKPQEKKDPFRKFELGDVKYKSNDERIRIEDLRFIQVPANGKTLTTLKLNAKNLTEKTFSQAYFFVALYDEDKQLLDVSLVALGKKENMFDTDEKLKGREAFSGETGFIGKRGEKAKYWQATVVIGKEE
jgi:hypothetical protein